MKKAGRGGPSRLNLKGLFHRAVADIGTILHTVKVHFMHAFIGNACRFFYRFAQTYHAEHTAAGDNRFAGIGFGASVEYVQTVGVCRQRGDFCAFFRLHRVAAGRQTTDSTHKLCR